MDSKCWNPNLNCGKRKWRSVFAAIQYSCIDQVSAFKRATQKYLLDKITWYLYKIIGETDVAWSFGDNDEDLQKFIVTSDSDHNEGSSKCSFVKSAAGYGLFSGTLDSIVPRVGTLRKSGYCNITSLRATVRLNLRFIHFCFEPNCNYVHLQKSFQRESYYDWSPYNMLVLRIRGDGRPYMINIWSQGFFDVTWNDTYQHVLYTRGGPHWQVSRVSASCPHNFIVSIPV